MQIHTDGITQKPPTLDIFSLFESLLQMFPAGSLGFVDTQYKILFTGGELYDSLHTRAEEIIGKRVNQVWPGVFPRIRKFYRQALRTRKVSFEIELEEHFLEIILIPYYQDNNKVLGAFWIALDISNRKKIEKELEDSQANLKALIENTTDLIWSIDRKYQLNASNSLFLEKIRSYLQRDLDFGENVFFEEFPEEWNRVWMENYNIALAGKSVIFEGRDFARTTRFRDYSLHPILDTQERVVGVSVLGRDITKRKQTEEFLKYLNSELESLNRELEDRVLIRTNELQDMVNSIPAGLLIFRCHQTSEFILSGGNETARKLFGIRSKRLNEIDLFSNIELKSSELLHTLKQGLEDTFHKRKSSLFILQSEENGQEKYLRLHIFVIDAMRVGAMVEDITETRKLEIDRETHRIVELEHRRIGQDLHDGLGGHLTGILFLLQALKGDTSSPEKVNDGLEKSGELIRKAINYTKGLVRGLVPEYLSQKGFFDSIKSLMEDLESIYGISCKLHVDNKLRFLEEEKYSQIFYIIREALNNAIKHGNTKQIEVSFKWYPERSEIMILNDGQDFPDKIPDGGLGLNIMQHRAQLIGASLTLSPRPDRGGTVCLVVLPHKIKNNESY
ncbi:MAG: PAS domain-containing protein [Spirochaetota bacterium]